MFRTGRSNTCWRVADRVLKAFKTRAKVVISIDKPFADFKGVWAGASSNAVATMLGLERVN